MEDLLIPSEKVLEALAKVVVVVVVVVVVGMLMFGHGGMRDG